MKQRWMTAGIAFLLMVIVTEWKGDMLETQLRQGLYLLRGDSLPNYAVTSLDAKGIPITYYATQNGIRASWQYNPTLISNAALAAYDNYLAKKDAEALKKLHTYAQWLAANMELHEQYALYRFPWQQPWYPQIKAPFTCGMTSGLAMEVFAKAHQYFPDEPFLQAARLLRNGFSVALENGGFTYFEESGDWYEEVAGFGGKTPRILDGHIYAILGVATYHQITKDDTATSIITKGVAALKQVLPTYDAGKGYIFYDVFHQKADVHYHAILADQMQQLANLTKDPIFTTYHKRWSAPLQKPYLWRVIRDANISGGILMVLLCIVISVLIGFMGNLWIKKK